MKNKKVPSYVIFIILYMAYTATYIARLNLSMAKPALAELGKLTTPQLALMGSLFSVIYASGRLLNGALGDKIKPWIMVSGGLFLAGLCNISIGFFPPFTGMLILWGVNAFAQSMLWSSVLCIVSAIYDVETAKKKTTIMVTSVATGNILGILVTSYLVNNFNIGLAFTVPGTITLILGAAVMLSANKVESQDKKAVKSHIPMYKLFARKDIMIMILPAMFHGAMKDNISLFMADYFVHDFSIDPTQNPLYILFIPIVGFLGRSVYSVFFKLFKYNEHKVSAMGFAFCALFALPLALGIKSAIIATISLSFIYAFVSIINTSLLSVYPMQFTKYGNVASVSGIMDFLTYLGHSISSAIYGFTIVKFGYGSMYSSWVILSIFALLLVLGSIINKNRVNAYIKFAHSKEND